MSRKIVLLFTTLVFFLTTEMKSQDIHFSQFYNSPLTLNPSLTGKVNGTYRIAANYRDQWFNVTSGSSPYVTPAASFDMPFMIGNNDAVGVGIQFFNDRNSGGRMTDLTILGSVAYHKGLGENHSISLGVQGGYAQKRLDSEQLQWPSQFSGTEFDPDLMGETLEDNSIGKFDFNAGLSWHGRFSERLHAYAGFSTFHIHEPSETFFDDSDATLPRRYLAHGGMDIGLSERWALLPSVVWMLQAEASQLNLGTAVGYAASEDVTLYLGGYYRLEDAAIAYLGIDFRNFRFGFSYDFTTSSLNQVSGLTGSFELSLMYIGQVIPLPEVQSSLFCPRF